MVWMPNGLRPMTKIKYNGTDGLDGPRQTMTNDELRWYNGTRNAGARRRQIVQWYEEKEDKPVILTIIFKI